MPPRAMKRRMRKRLAMVSPGEKADCGGAGCEGRGPGGPCSTRLMPGVGMVDCESRVCWLASSSGGLRGESSVGMGVVGGGIMPQERAAMGQEEGGLQAIEERSKNEE